MNTTSPVSASVVYPLAFLEPIGRIGQLTAINIGKMTEIHHTIAQRYLDMSAQRLLRATEIRDGQTLEDYLHHHLEMLGDFSLNTLKDTSRLTDLGMQLHSDMSQVITDSFSVLLGREDSDKTAKAKPEDGKNKPPENRDEQEPPDYESLAVYLDAPS